MSSKLLPSPVDVGLPPKFTDWRPRQDEAIIRAAESEARFVVLCMPTGSGKSLTYMAMAKLTGWRTAVLTATKGLQNQAVSDFQSAGLMDVRGMGNYPCQHLILRDKMGLRQLTGGNIDRTPMCDIGPCLGGFRCEFRDDGCDYYGTVSRARYSKLVITNYAYWLTSQRSAVARMDAVRGEGGASREQGLAKFDMLVLDEAHDAPEELGSFLGVEITMNQAHDLLEIDWPRDHDNWLEWQTWAHDARAAASKQAGLLEYEVKSGTASGIKLRRYMDLKRLETNLSRVASSEGEWVHTMARTGPRAVMMLKFDPIWPGEYSEKFLFAGTPKVILTSATVRPKTLELLGVPPDQIDFIEYPSTFPISRRPVLWSPTIRVDRRASTDDMRRWVVKIDNIIRGRLDRKGIIHTVSYERRDWILKWSEYRSIMVTHETATTRDRIAQFKKMAAPAVMVSPSLSTGYDFPYEECSYQIIGKVPFPDSRNKIIAARTKIDPGYAHYLTMQILVQASGRGMRAADDVCETLVIDDHIGWFMGKWGEKFAPKWFRESYKKVVGIPTPPKLTARRRG